MSDYCGRFAPSPTGFLHFGSLVSAMGSYLEAITHQGKWILRIDNVDQTRAVKGMDQQIIQTLEKLGFEWHGDVQYQTQHQQAYQAALQQLKEADLIYACQCSRRSWQNLAQQGSDGAIYPETCRNKKLPDNQNHALRLCTQYTPISFHDAIQNEIRQILRKDIGDFVVRRADGLVAYQLAVVVDDALAGISHVVRGADLLISTPRQIYLQQLLGYTTPKYLHIPLVYGGDGKKLSKSNDASQVDPSNPIPALMSAWQFLQQTEIPALDSVQDFWQWAKQHWDTRHLTRKIHTNANG